MADEDEIVGKLKKVQKTLADCRFFQSPFVEIADNAYRILLQKYGTHVVCLPLVNSSRIDNEWLNAWKIDKGDGNYFVQVIVDNEESVIQAAEIIQECHCHVSAIIISLPQEQNLTDEVFQNLLSSFKSIHTKISIPVACKLVINLDDIDKTVKMAEQLHYVGCKIILLHGHIHGDHKPSVLKKENWNLAKKIRDSVSQETVIVLETGCQSIHEAEQCLGFTGVNGIAVAEPLMWNPGFFLKKRPSVLQMIKDYVELCKKCNTQLDTAKATLVKFCGYVLNRFSGLKEKLVHAPTHEDINKVVESLNEELVKLTKKQAKALGRLQQKKEHYRMKKLRRKREAIAGVTVCGEPDDQSFDERLTKRQAKLASKEKIMSALLTGQKVAIDLSLDDRMTDKEITKVAGQIRRLYGSNLKSPRPFHLYITGMSRNGRIYAECTRQNDGFEKYMIDMSEKKVSEIFCDPENVVYLSPDSQNILGELDPQKVYVIGGLVDHQIIKGVSLSEAGSCRLNTARLPIDEYMQKSEPGNHSYSRVLTINQVFDIILKYHETKDWVQALNAGVPKRNGFILKHSSDISNQAQGTSCPNPD